MAKFLEKSKDLLYFLIREKSSCYSIEQVELINFDSFRHQTLIWNYVTKSMGWIDSKCIYSKSQINEFLENQEKNPTKQILVSRDLSDFAHDLSNFSSFAFLKKETTV